MGPRADFACLAKSCQQDGAATIYELPVAATRCPVCGSKRIRRLYNHVNVSHGIAAHVDRAVEPVHAQQQAVRDSANRSRRESGIVHAVPIGKGQGTSADYIGYKPGTARPAPSHADPVIRALLPKLKPQLGPGTHAVRV